MRPSRGILANCKRRLLKTGLFALLVLVVLNPNLKRAWQQVRHVLQPERLVQTDFPALPRINAEIDRLVAHNHGRASEARLVAKFVVRKIQYVSDYENWSNLDYWPTAQETWALRQEDCDGRAILATSILRSRGFHSARLVVGLDHMWVKVNENELILPESPHFVALLSPNPDFSLDLDDGLHVGGLMRLAQALLHPTALCETSSHLFADIPVGRKTILILALLLLCYHPCTQRRRLLAVLAAGLASVALLARWEPGNGHQVEGICGMLLLGCALAVARPHCPNASP